MSPGAATAASLDQSVVLGEFDLWSIDPRVQEYVGDASKIKTRITYLTFAKPRPKPKMSELAAYESALAVTVAEEVMQGAFQQAIMNAPQEVLKALGLITAQLHRDRTAPDAYGRIIRRSKKSPGALVITMPKVSAGVRLDFIPDVKKDEPTDVNIRDMLMK